MQGLYRERGIRALARRPLGRDSRLRGNDGKNGGNDGEEAGVTMTEGEMDSEREQAHAPPRDGARGAPSPRSPRGHVIPAKAGTYRMRPLTRKRAPTPTQRAPTAVPSPAAFAASSLPIGREGYGRLRACGRGARRPVSKPSTGPRHSRASGNLPHRAAPTRQRNLPLPCPSATAEPTSTLPVRESGTYPYPARPQQRGTYPQAALCPPGRESGTHPRKEGPPRAERPLVMARRRTATPPRPRRCRRSRRSRRIRRNPCPPPNSCRTIRRARGRP